MDDSPDFLWSAIPLVRRIEKESYNPESVQTLSKTKKLFRIWTLEGKSEASCANIFF